MNPLDSAPSSDELMSMESLKALVAANGARIACLCAKLGVKVDAPRESTPTPTTAPICVQGAVSALPVLVETSSTPALQPRIVPKPKPSTPTKCSMECLDEQDNETCQVFGEITRKVSDPAVDLMTARPTMCLLHSSSHVPGQGVPLLATTVRVPPHPPDWPGTPQKQEAPPPPWPPSATSSIHHKEQCKLSNEGVNALGSYLAIICACPHGTSISSHIIREMVVKVSTRQSLSQFAHNQSAQLVRTQQATYFLHVEQLLASRLSRQWDPEGSKYACWVLNCKYFDGNTKVYFRNMRVDLNVWEKDKFRVISIELYVQWDPGIMKVLLMLAMFWENLQSILGPDFYPRTSKDDLSLDAITLSQASGQRIVFCLPSMWDISESLFQFFVGVIQAEQVGEIRHMKCKEESEILENIQEKFRMLPADIFHMNFRVQLISLENQFLSLEAFKGSVATWLPSTQMKVAEDNGETDHCCFHWASRLCLVQRQNMLLGVLCSTPSPTLQVSIKYLLEQQNERSSSLFAAIELTLCTLQRRMLQPVEELKELESTYRAENHGAVDSVVSVCTPLIHNINTCPLGNFLGGILSKKKAEGQWWIICQTKLKCGASICSLEEDSKCMILTNRKKMIYLTVIYPMSSCNSGFASSRSIRHPVHEFSGRRSSGVDVKLVANFVALLLGSLPQLSFSLLGYYNCHKYLLHGKNIWLHSCSGWKYFRLPDDSYQPCDPSLINWNPNAMHNVSLKLSWGQAMSPEMEISLLGYVGNFAEHFPRAEKLRSLWNVSCKLAYGLQLVPCCYVWLSHGFVLMCHCHATPLSNYQWADEDAADTRKQHAVQVQSMETPWDPGGATGRWWSSPCYNREPFQGGSIVIALDTFFEQVHVDQHYYLDFYDGYFIDLAQVRSNNGYHCDNSSTKERQVAWDPGGKGWHRLEGKAEFQGGRNATGLPSTRPWASCWMGQRLSLQQLRYKRKDSGNQGGIEDELCCG